MINEIINLSLSNGATLDEGEQVVNLPNEFIEQFKTGQAKEIDTAICAKTDGCNEARWFSLTTRNVNDGQIQGVINKLWGVDTSYKSVSKFHVFHDSTNFYGSTGNARGQAVMNISNAAFPILMARNDKNYWLAFGEKRARIKTSWRTLRKRLLLLSRKTLRAIPPPLTCRLFRWGKSVRAN